MLEAVCGRGAMYFCKARSVTKQIQQCTPSHALWKGIRFWRIDPFHKPREDLAGALEYTCWAVKCTLPVRESPRGQPFLEFRTFRPGAGLPLAPWGKSIRHRVNRSFTGVVVTETTSVGASRLVAEG